MSRVREGYGEGAVECVCVNEREVIRGVGSWPPHPWPWSFALVFLSGVLATQLLLGYHFLPFPLSSFHKLFSSNGFPWTLTKSLHFGVIAIWTNMHGCCSLLARRNSFWLFFFGPNLFFTGMQHRLVRQSWAIPSFGKRVAAVEHNLLPTPGKRADS